MEFPTPIQLDAVHVYPTMPRFSGTTITEDLRCNYELRVETIAVKDETGATTTAWKTVPSVDPSVTERFDTDPACRSYPRLCLANVHRVQRRLPMVVGPLCSLKEDQYYNTTCTDQNITEIGSGHLRLLRYKQFAVQAGFEQFMTVPFDTLGLPYNQTVLPGDPEPTNSNDPEPSWDNIPGGKAAWHSHGLEYIQTIEIHVHRTLFQGLYEAALTGIHLYKRTSTNHRPFACEEKLYCFDGVAQSGMEEQIFTTPQPCARGAYCKRGCPRSQGTAQCPTGEFCEKGTSDPIKVPEGQFAEGTGNPSGATCFAGTYTSKRGSSSCVDCPMGNYCPAITDTCWGRNPNVTNDARHEGFFSKEDDVCDTTNMMDIKIQNILVSNSFNPATGTGYPLGSTPKEAGRNDTIICKAGFICSQSKLSSVTQTCDKGHYCLEGTLASANHSNVNTDQECSAPTHCANVLTKGEKAAVKFNMNASTVNITVTSTATMAMLPDHPLNNLINGNMPNICPRWVKREITPTGTTPRYRGKYDGCTSYDGLILKGVSDVRIELYIDLQHREPTGDPLTNLFQSQNPDYVQYIGQERPIRGEYCRSDSPGDGVSIPCTQCGLLTDYGVCPSLDEIGLSASTAIYNELAKQSPSKINVWYIHSEEAYYMKKGLTRRDRMASAKLVLGISYRGAALLKNTFAAMSTFNLTLQLNHSKLARRVPRPYAVQFNANIGAFTSRGPWEEYRYYTACTTTTTITTLHALLLLLHCMHYYYYMSYSY